MNSPRQRRLENDYARIKRDFSGHPHISVVPVEGDPPERYLLAYRVPGLRLNQAGVPVKAELFEFEMYLHREFPRGKPKITAISPIFHPNIRDWVCIGDYWASGETLSDVIVQVGEMIQYRKYNTRSALDGEAAEWAEGNAALFPVGAIDLYLSEPVIELGPGEGDGEKNLGITLG